MIWPNCIFKLSARRNFNPYDPGGGDSRPGDRVRVAGIPARVTRVRVAGIPARVTESGWRGFLLG
ncbi:hypothetical protein E2C01_093770 [Portunus trituberculatus]|uniref:Uncharacterized protein n=1 Tax=Portunus trituberculatus TaxID=210409 RepID=A0A5B7JK06_PORTR|nr:hypothetical protein [Portunus trituberculatus]